MAILKHIASKNADYNAAYRYLVFDHDEDTGKELRDAEGYLKLREKYLIGGINCTPETFAMECRKTNQRFHKNTKPNEIRTHQYIVSFDPKDRELGLTMEKAQEMGMKFAEKNFPGHQVLVATHDDGNGNHSGNIHFHIIVNSVRAFDAPTLDYEMRDCDTRAGFKHNCTKAFLKYLENEVSSMCLEQGYHQVDFEHSDKRITNSEYRIVHREQKSMDAENEERGKKTEPGVQTKFESEKEKLRQKIDEAINTCNDEESFRSYLKTRYGIEVKESRGRWGYLIPNRQKPIRARKLGDRYEKESILALLSDKQKAQEQTTTGAQQLQEKKNHSVELIGILAESPAAEKTDYLIICAIPVQIGRLIDIEHNEKIKNNPGYLQWAKVHNLQTQAEAFNYMEEHQLLQGQALEEEYQKLVAELDKIHGEQKSLRTEVGQLNSEIRMLGQYFAERKIWKEYCESGKSDQYFSDHSEELESYQQLKTRLQERYNGQKLPDIKTLKARKQALLEQASTIDASAKELEERKQRAETLLAQKMHDHNRKFEIQH